MPTASKTTPKKLSRFLEKIGIQPGDESLYAQAMIHRSALNEGRQGLQSNERLEFLGDSVLGLITAQYLFNYAENLTEGQMARRKAALVSESTLAQWARQLKLGSQLVLGRGEALTGGRDKPAILADAFEALLAALYLDRGMSQARKFVEPLLTLQVEQGNPARADAKSRLQELTQQLFKKAPRYEVDKAEGPDHAKIFEVQVLAEGKVLGRGKGRNKKEAEQKAAEKALLFLKKSKNSGC